MSVELVKSLIAEHGEENVAIICNHSGGKDSQRMLGFLREQFPTLQTLVVMADTGFEHVKPVSAKEFARESAARYGLDLHVVRNPNKTYLEMVEKRGKFPAMDMRQCTSDLKRGPIQTWLSQQVRNGTITAKIILNCTGIRAAESNARAKQNPWTLNEGMNKGAKGKELTPKATMFGHTVINWMPIFRESLQDVLNWHWQNNMPLHPVYVPAYHVDGTTGGYLRRLSCRLCIFSTETDIRAIYQQDREAFDLVADLEKRINFTMRSGKTLFQIIDQPDPNGDQQQHGDEELADTPCM